METYLISEQETMPLEEQQTTEQATVVSNLPEGVTAILPNAGWVIKNGENVYDPEAYAAVMSISEGRIVSVGELGLLGPLGEEYGGETGKAPELPGNYKDLSPLEQFNVTKEQGLIPLNSEFIPGKNGDWSYIPIMSKTDYEILTALPESQRIATIGGGTKEFQVAQLKYESPELYKVLTDEGWVAYEKAYEKIIKEQQQAFENAQKEWENELKISSPDLYKVYKEQGYETFVKTVDDYNKQVVKANADYDAFQRKVQLGEIIPLPDGKYITKEEFTKQPYGVQNILMAKGFIGLETPGLIWEDRRTGKQYTTADKKKLLDDWFAQYNKLDKEGLPLYVIEQKIGENPVNYIALTAESGRQVMANLGISIASFIFPPAKALREEYTIKDVSGIEWGLGAVNVAFLSTSLISPALLATIAGKITIAGLSATGTGLISYEAVKNWSELTPLQKGINIGGAVLYSLPLMATVARGIKITSVKIPTAEGEIATWKGLAIANNPILGKSEGQWILGARNITLPEVKLILNGWKPETVLETKVFVNKSRLLKAGLGEEQVDYLITSLKDRNMFAGSKSPYFNKEVLLESTARLDADEISVLMKQIQKYNKDIKQVDLLYGSTTMKAQLAPELRGWREVHDWDIQTSMNMDDTATFAKSILEELNTLPGGKQYRISPKNPNLVEKKINGVWEHIADIHAIEELKSLSGLDIPKSKLDSTGQYSYGRMVSEPAIKIKYPGVGEFDIMSLSETGVRKMDTIARIRQIEGGTILAPPERGIAAPGVPKDVADFYVILKTYELGGVLRTGIADEWLVEWAKTMGYKASDLPKLLPRLKDAINTILEETPSNLIGYRFRPATTTVVKPGASPSISIGIPKGLETIGSPSLRTEITKEYSPSIAMSSKIAIPSLKLSGKVSPSIVSLQVASVSPKLSPAQKASASKILSTSLGIISPSYGIMPSPSKPISVGALPSKGISPSKGLSSPSPSKSPSPSRPPSPKPKPSPGPSPKVVPYKSPPPSPPPTKKPPPEKPSPSIIVLGADTEAKHEAFRGAITWKQGFGWWAIKEPYKSRADAAFFYKEPPPGAKIVKGGAKSALHSIQALTGKAPEKLELDLGIMDVIITQPTVAPGRSGAIRFTRDIKQRTMSDITIGKINRRRKKISHRENIETLGTVRI